MAEATIAFRWSQGDELTCVIEVEANYPDAVNEAKAQALAMFREAFGVAVAGDE